MLCKVYIRRYIEFQPGFFGWHVGFAIGKSNRQLSDWFWEKKNRRAKSIRKKMTGKSGLKLIKLGFEKVLDLRWKIEPGDAIIFDCSSAYPDKQFHAWKRWQRKHPDIFINEEKKEFVWHRPPHYVDPVWQKYKIIPKVPKEPLAYINEEIYHSCFEVITK